MEAQAAAQKLAAQHAANAALRSLTPAAAPGAAPSTASGEPADLEDGVAAVQPESPPGGVLSSSSDEPTDLTMDAEEKAIRNRDRMEREHRYTELTDIFVTSIIASINVLKPRIVLCNSFSFWNLPTST